MAYFAFRCMIMNTQSIYLQAVEEA